MRTERVRYGSRGQGSLLKFSNSPNWYTAIRVRGGEVVQTTGTSDLKAARRVHRQRLDESALDRQGAKVYAMPAAKRVTVAELLDACQHDVELRDLKSAYKTVAHSKPIRQRFGSMRAVDVTPESVDRYVEQLRAEGLAAATVNRRIQTLASAFKLARARKRVHEVPQFRKLSEQGNTRLEFFTEEEVERIVVELPDYLKDMVRFAFLCGWRRGELIALRWEWVNLADETICLPMTKNGSPRTLALSGVAAEIIRRREVERLLERDGSPYVASHVFHNAGRPIRDFDHAWRVAMRKAGVVNRRFHDLRRSAIRRLVRSGVSETVAMSISGHKSRAVFQRYNITSADDQRRAMEAVSK